MRVLGANGRLRDNNAKVGRGVELARTNCSEDETSLLRSGLFLRALGVSLSW